MTENEAISLVVAHLKSLFPLNCPACGRLYRSYREFVLTTEPLGTPISYDLDTGDINPLNPLGAVSFSRCTCGATVGLTSKGMPIRRLLAVLLWGKEECEKKAMKPAEFLQQLRLEIRRRVQDEAAAEPA
jgi:hypothetical protein